mgnify:CR=1 FL=1
MAFSFFLLANFVVSDPVIILDYPLPSFEIYLMDFLGMTGTPFPLCVLKLLLALCFIFYGYCVLKFSYPSDALGRRVTCPYEFRIGEASLSATTRFYVADP